MLLDIDIFLPSISYEFKYYRTQLQCVLLSIQKSYSKDGM